MKVPPVQPIAAAVWESVDGLTDWDGGLGNRNPRVNDHAVEPVARSIWTYGFGAPLLARMDGQMVAGHTRRKAYRYCQAHVLYEDPTTHAQVWRDRRTDDGPFIARGSPGPGLVPVRRMDLTDAEARALALADNRTGELATWDDAELQAVLKQLSAEQVDLTALGWSADDLQDLIHGTAPKDRPPRPSLTDQFIVPPFTVLDARQGYWRDRKNRWLAIGLRSEMGRGAAVAAAGGGELNTIGGRPLPLDPNKRQGTASSGLARSFGQDLMRGEHVVGSGKANGKTRRGDGRGRTLTPRREADRASNLNNAPPLPEWAQEMVENMAPGTSIFDPVVCELAYRWFSPVGGAVLDPFAGGSVRGIVAGLLGRSYIGIDLRAEQVAANEQQWLDVARQGAQSAIAPPVQQAIEYSQDADALTPIQWVALPGGGRVALKREDLFAVDADGLLNGSKPRALIALAKQEGAIGLVAASSRNATMGSRVAMAAQILGLPCRIHTATGDDTTETTMARDCGADIVQHSPGYLTVLQARGREDARERGWLYVPLGMEHPISIQQVAPQAANVPNDGSVRRIVVPVGSGTALAGVLWGMVAAGIDLPVLGVCVREDAVRKKVVEKLNKEGPPGWAERVTLVPCGMAYSDEVPANDCWLDGVQFDPMYEAKILRFLEDGDLFWIVGIRGTARARTQTAQAAQAAPAIQPSRPTWVCGDSLNLSTLLPAKDQFDLVFSCPPYGDLERYSDDPLDLSTMDRSTFLTTYRQIIAQAVARLRPNRFAVFVVGDYRDKGGFYQNFVSETIAAFEAAGARLYNEAILVTAAGSLPIRIGRQFASGRKLGKTHQNILVFYKGDPSLIRAELGTVDVSFPPEVDLEAVDGPGGVPDGSGG